MKTTRNILVLVTGGISAYKTPALCRLLIGEGFSPRVVMTRAACCFVTREALEQTSASKVFTDFEGMSHIELARWADGVVVAPATLHALSRFAWGLCDDLLGCVFQALSSAVPIWIAPAMNPQMWEKAGDKVARLRQRGVRFVGPSFGETACGEVGLGRMAEPAEIARVVTDFFRDGHRLANRRVLVTAGPTLEALDAVRFLSNRSSGLQGFALAEAFASLGAEVLLVAGPTSVPPPEHERIALTRVESTASMLSACLQSLPVSIAVFAAAVADFRPQSVRPQSVRPQSVRLQSAGAKGRKLPKDSIPLSLTLEETPDILATIACRQDRLRPLLVVGFAAETGQEAISRASDKRKRKNCDWLFANDVSRPVFGEPTNQGRFFDHKGHYEDWPQMTKQALARKLAMRAVEFLETRREKDAQKS